MATTSNSPVAYWAISSTIALSAAPKEGGLDEVLLSDSLLHSLFGDFVEVYCNLIVIVHRVHFVEFFGVNKVSFLMSFLMSRSLSLPA